jgi:hypothetical protein
MHFNEKFNLLMKIANTTNTKLAKALGIDPSLVSRWRTGAREPADDSRYIQLLGVFFASQARQDFQRVALLELTGHQMEDKNIGESVIATYLTRWLSNESKISKESIHVLLDSIGSVGNHPHPIPNITLPVEPDGQAIELQSFSGTEGLRSATIKLLMRALKSNKTSQKLLLFSDEPMDWIIENPLFAKQWFYLMSSCIRKGMKIEVIHTLSRDSNEMAIAVQRWLPFYMTGAIVSYYYPEKRDDMFNHTAFILEGEALVTSTSVRGQSRDTVHYIYTTEDGAVTSAQIGFAAQRTLCKPLVRTYTGDFSHKYLEEQVALLATNSGNGVGMQSLLVSGMPITLLESMLMRKGISEVERGSIIEKQRERIQITQAHLMQKKFLMVISLPRITDVLKGKVPALLPELLTHQPFTYLPMEFHAHLLAIIAMLETYEHLEIAILPNKHMLHTVQLFAVQNAGLLVLKHRNPKFVFISEQNDLIGAIMRFINQEAARIPKRERNKQYVIEKLKAFVQRIEEGAEKRMLP